MKLNKKAFTLVEMLIVVVIIGILAAALLPKLLSAQARARDTARKADLGQILTSMKMYYNDEASYPSVTETSGCAATGFSNLMDDYMSTIPNDPQKKRVVSLNGTDCIKFYGYIPVKSAGTVDGAGVLGANLEVFGSAMNWVLADGGYLTGDGDTVGNYDIKGSGAGSDLPKQVCSEGVFEADDTTDITCGGSVRRGETQDDGKGVYVVFPN